MIYLTTMEKQVLKAFVDSYHKAGTPDPVVELRNIKFPRGMNGPQKRDVIQSLRNKGMFRENQSSGISTTEQLASEAIRYFAKGK